MPDTSTSQSPPSDTEGATERIDDLALGSIGMVVFSDILCPWAHIGVFRLRRAVHERGLEGEINIDHRAFPLEVLGDEAHGRRRFDRMVEALQGLEPDAGWSPWAGGDDDFPTSSLIALEAVQAAKAVSPDAAADLDRGLRRAVFAESRPIDDLDTILAVARDLDAVDMDTFETELSSGRARRELDEQTTTARSGAIPASPTVVLPDGTTSVNPGIEFHTGDDGVPVIDSDDPGAYDRLIDAYLEQRTYD